MFNKFVRSIFKNRRTKCVPVAIDRRSRLCDMGAHESSERLDRAIDAFNKAVLLAVDQDAGNDFKNATDKHRNR